MAVRQFRAFALAGWLVWLAGCGSSGPAAPSPVDVQVVLAPEESVRIASASVALRFVGVFGDSRCPADAICILGGNATVRIEVLAVRPITYDLHTAGSEAIR